MDSLKTGILGNVDSKKDYKKTLYFGFATESLVKVGTYHILDPKLT